MSKHRLWATEFDRPGARPERHASEVATYRYVENERANWAANPLRSTRYLSIYVDERKGRGFELYETIDLSQ